MVVHEARRTVGFRFGGDLQGLENWTTEQDALEELDKLGLTTRFELMPCREGMGFDDRRRAYPIRSSAPLFYLLRRGPAPGTLDHALLQQALSLDVEVHFESKLSTLDGPGLLAIGPKAADAIAVGYHFDTDDPDGFWVICDDALAPDGYAYLLIMNGQGTIKSCMFRDFKQEQRYVRRTVEAFRSLVAPDMRNMRPHGGAANFRFPELAHAGAHNIIGEQAGFQDALWGFGMRFAMRSGVLAAHALLEGGNYETAWRNAIGPWMRASIVNRALYATLGSHGYRFGLRRQAGRDARVMLHKVCSWSSWKRMLEPWARRSVQTLRKDSSCDHVDCDCIWCRTHDHNGTRTGTT